jgi:hypothetical protein
MKKMKGNQEHKTINTDRKANESNTPSEICCPEVYISGFLTS